MTSTCEIPRRSRLLGVLIAAMLVALIAAVPAGAQNRQESRVTQTCNEGDGGECEQQERSVQQKAGGSVSRSITQRQTVGGRGDDRVREQSDDEDAFDDEEDFEDEEDSGGDVSVRSDDERQSTQQVSGTPRGGVETGGGGTLDLERTSNAAGAPALGVVPLLAALGVLGLVALGLLGLRRGRAD